MPVSPSVKIASLSSALDGILPFQPEFADLLNKQHFYQNSKILQSASKPAHPVTLRQLSNFGQKLTKSKIISSANFVRTELPLRLSLRVKEMQDMNFDITNNYHLNQVYQSYCYCFNAFQRAPVFKTLEDNERFCNFLSHVLDDHLIILPHLMMGTLEVSNLRTMPQGALDRFISNMIRSRISRRVIMEQHLSLSKSFQNQSDSVVVKAKNYIGEAFEFGSAYDHLRMTSDAVKSFVEKSYPYLQMPQLEIEGEDVKFEFLTSHLNYIFAEIFRNAYQSTIEHLLRRNLGKSKDQLSKMIPPPVVVQITKSKDGVSFKFSDQGGGMSSEQLEQIWSFGKSAKMSQKYLQNFHRFSERHLPRVPPMSKHQYWDKRSYNSDDDVHEDTDISGVLGNVGRMEPNKSRQKSTLYALAGRPFEDTIGISLPMCKVYTDYWNGSLDMYSVEGYGTDVYLTLGKIGTNNDKLRLDKA